MNLQNELGTYLYDALREHTRERANLNRSLKSLQKILGGVAVGVFTFITFFGEVGKGQAYSFSSVISDNQIATFIVATLLGAYFLTKHRYSQRVYGELDRIKKEYGEQVPESWKILNAADRLYEEVCKEQKLSKSTL